MNTNGGSLHYVNLTDLDLRSFPQPLNELNLAQHYNRLGKGTSPGTKRRRVFRHNTPLSPRSSRFSTPTVSTNGLEYVDLTELGESSGQAYHSMISGDMGNRTDDTPRDNWLEKQALSYLFSPPQTDSDYSPRGSIISDTQSVASTARYVSPPGYNSGDQIDNDTDGEGFPRNNRPLRSPDSDCYPSTYMNYPQTIDLTVGLDQPSPRTTRSSSEPNCWVEPRNSSMVTDKASSTPRSITFQGCLYVLSGRAADILQSDLDQVEDPDKIDCEKFDYHDNLIKLDLSRCAAIGDQMIYIPEEQVTGQEITIETPKGCPNELLKSALEINTDENASCNTLGAQSAEEKKIQTVQPTTDNEDSCVDSADEHSSVAIYLKKGNLDRIEDWGYGIPENMDTLPVDSQSPSTSILMTTAEEELEERVSRAFGNGSASASILISKLKQKLSIILPLFCDEEDRSPFEFLDGYSYYGYERGAATTSTSSSTQSVGAKSTVGASITTPATSADLGEEDDDDVPNERERSRKRPRISHPRDRGVPERRRLRCHFHAKCPITHTQRACVLSPGYLSIHNLRGHYISHHTRIRCNKCFREFEFKTLKNRHQMTCTATQSPPTLEVIDCDKTDEIEEVFANQLPRTWRLDIEENEEMKLWISKYKVEFNNNNMPTDEPHDCRELAKWYHIWRILFPSSQGPVPSPFQSPSISPGTLKMEGFLEIFQSAVDTKVAQNQLPPMDHREQIEYYKDAIRTVFRLFLPTPSSNPGSSPPSDRPPVSTPANYVTSTVPSRQSIVSSVQNSNPMPEQSLNNQVRSRSPSIRFEDSQLPQSSSSTFGDSSAPLSLSSPCAADTRGAVGESPILMRSERRLTDQDASSPQQAFNFQAQNSPNTQMTASLSTQNAMGLPPQHLTNSGNVMLPPSRRRNAPNNASRNIEQRLMVQRRQQYNQQHQFRYPMGDTAAQFTSNPPTMMFQSQNMMGDQGGQAWTDLPIDWHENFGCQFCSDTGLVILNNSEVQACSCGQQNNLQN